MAAVRIAVGGVGGQQHLFLELEVQTLLLDPVREECRCGVVGVLLAGPAQPLGQHECMVVIARQGTSSGWRFIATGIGL